MFSVTEIIFQHLVLFIIIKYMYIDDDECRQFKLKPLQSKQQESTIKIDKLEFLGSGLDHVVFERMDNPGELVIFKRSVPTKTKEGRSFAQKNIVLQSIYQSALDLMFPQLNKYRSRRTAMQFPTQLPFHFYQSLEDKLKCEKQNAQEQEQPLSIDRQSEIVYMGTSVFERSKYNTIIQFKPKTILPDKYTRSAIQKVSQQHGLLMCQLQQILLTAPLAEKLRWFKKQRLEARPKKGNMNPLLTFKVDIGNGQPPQFTETKCFKSIPSLTTAQTDLLNRCILQQIHREPELLQYLLALQSLFLYSPEHLDISEATLSQIDEEKLKSELINAINEFLSGKQKVDLSTYAITFMKQTCLSSNPPCEWSSQCALLLFLISLTWKDVSFVYLATFDGSMFQNSKIRIIDDYLKGIEKVRGNVKKDIQLLSKYIKFKLTT